MSRLFHFVAFSRRIATALLLLAVATPVEGQRPTQAQVEAALQRPGAAAMVRERLRSSGLTPEQIRARLSASGFNAGLLDAYIATDGSPDAVLEAPSSEQEEAMRVLGIPEIDAPTAPLALGAVANTEVMPSGIFGVDVFRRNTTQFLPLLSGPAPPDYRLGPGDALVLILTGDVEAAHQLPITREGFVLIPQVGQVYLANLTMEQARSTLLDRLGRVYSGVRRGAAATTHFELSVASVRAVQVFVIGEVNQPGAYQVSALGTALTALYTAGGVTEMANLRNVGIRRGGRTVATFDLYDYLLRGDTRSDIRLENGDVIYVGIRERRVQIQGAVRRAAWYDVGPAESLRDLLAAAGGIRADGSLSRITIDRVLPASQRSPGGPQRVVIDVPVSPGDSLLVPAIPLEDDDKVTVLAVDAEASGFVTIEGNVYLPGRVGFAPGMRLSQLLRRAGGGRRATYAGRAHIARLNPEDQTRRLIAVQLPADSTAPWIDDPVLQNEDVVTIYGLLKQRPEREVVISGAVNTPRRIPFVEGMTVRDLVLAADGLAPGAWLDSVEIARLPSPRAPGALAVTIRVPIDSTYLFDRDTLGRYIGPPGGQFRSAGAADFALEPWDNVVVFRQPEWELQRTVSVFGQVRFPGRYALRSRTQRVSELIAHAGGLAPSAYPLASEFWRHADSRGRVGFDLIGAMRNPQSPSNLILMAGDSIYVPEYVPLVQVGGAVHAPAAVLFIAGRKLDDYIDAAGGLSRDADMKRTYVIQPSGAIESVRRRALLPDHHPVPLAGAVVVVPAKDPADRKDYVSLMSSIAQIVAAVVTVVIVATK